jgi:formate/nitrite transporter FocA (FNT family)
MKRKLIRIKKEHVKQKVVKLFYQGIIKKLFVNLAKESAM